jgi:hypothetical protein
MKGYKAKSHYLCIKKWVVDAVGRNIKPIEKTSLLDDQEWIEEMKNKNREVNME